MLHIDADNYDNAVVDNNLRDEHTNETKNAKGTSQEYISEIICGFPMAPTSSANIC